MKKKNIFLVFAIAMIAMTIAFTACSADRETTNRRPTPTPDSELMRTPIDSTHQLELERGYTDEQKTSPRKIPICVKRNKTELRPLGIVDDVMYLGINDNGKIIFASTIVTNCFVWLPYIQGQNYYLSTTTVFKNVIVEETTEILYYN